MMDSSNRTALDLRVEEWKDYDPLRAARQHHSLNRDQLARRRRRAMRIARRAATLLRTNFSAKRIVLFGSLANRGEFTLWSDIDLAVWDVAPARFYAAVAVVTGMSAEFKIDLVDIESCGPFLRKAIEQKGIDL
jgi:predicted nucleotidyltransferase